MPIILSCSACQGKLRLPDAFTGKAVKCPKCAQVVRVTPSAAAFAPPAAPVTPAPPAAPASSGSIVVTCASCGGRTKAPAAMAGRTVPCSTCESPVRVPAAGAAASARPAAAGTSAAPTPASTPAAAQAPGVISLVCPGCHNKLKVSEKLAGKAVKCPKCTQTVKVPAAAPAAVAVAAASPTPPAAEVEPTATAGAAWGREWIEVNEGVAAPAGSVAAGPAGGQNLALLDGLQVTDDMRQECVAAMSRGERLVWADRPQVEIMLDKARKLALIGGIGGGVAIFIGLAVGCGLLFKAHAVLAGLITLLAFGGIGALILFFTVRAPGQMRRNADKRAVYMVTNRRALIHNGTVSTISFGKGQMTTSNAQGGVTPYGAPRLFRMRRVPSKKFPGSGDLKFGRSVFEEPSGDGFDDVAQVKDVEMLVRRTLIDPLIDKVLSGQTPPSEQAELKKETLDKDNNIKDAPGVMRGQAAFGDNIKDAPGAGGDNVRDAKSFERELAKAPAEAREQVEAELTAGEKILWIGEPEAGVKGRGFLGAMVGSAQRKEPAYVLYAITSRRVLLWDKPPAWNKDPSPTSYYSPQLSNLGLEKDDRVKNGGNILFRVVKYTITTTDKKGNSRTRVEMHYFGLLHIPNYRAVARLIYEKLVEPLLD